MRLPCFADTDSAARLGAKFAGMDTRELVRLAIEDLFPGRIALVSSFGADSAVLLHLVAQIDKTTPVLFIDTRVLFAETLAYRDELVAHLGLSNVITTRAKARAACGGRSGKLPLGKQSRPLLRNPQGLAASGSARRL